MRPFCPRRARPRASVDGAPAPPYPSSPRSGRGAAWLARFLGVEEVGGSNPLAPTNSSAAPCRAAGARLASSAMGGLGVDPARADPAATADTTVDARSAADLRRTADELKPE